MALRCRSAIGLILLVSACTPSPIQLDGNIEVTVISEERTAPTRTQTTTKPKVGGEKFAHISKLSVAKGPCPERDPASYGLLLKSRTRAEGDKIVCYYN
jgi:hypothetical protein